MAELLHADVTREIIGAAYEVHTALGYGFLEKVYENGMAVELELRSQEVAPQYEIEVFYKGRSVGFYRADLFVAGKVIVEIKAEKVMNSRHEAQLLHYLKATGVRVGLLINFGQAKCEVKRLIV